MKKWGFTDPRLVKSNLITAKNKELEEKVDIKFCPVTRLLNYQY